MLRWLAYTFSVVCGLVLLATIVLWVRSYWVHDAVLLHWVRASERTVSPRYTVVTMIGTAPGQLTAFDYRAPRLKDDPWCLDHWTLSRWAYADIPEIDRPKSYPLFPLLAAWTRPTLVIGRMPSLRVDLAFWMLALALCTGTIPGLWVWGHRWRRRARGLCGTCGYDLRASPERSPECGTPVSARHRPAVLDAVQ